MKYSHQDFFERAKQYLGIPFRSRVASVYEISSKSYVTPKEILRFNHCEMETQYNGGTESVRCTFYTDGDHYCRTYVTMNSNYLTPREILDNYFRTNFVLVK